MRKITVEVTTTIIVGIIVGLFHGVIGWVIAGIDRLNLTIPTYFDSVSFFAVNFIISNIFALVVLFGIKSDKFFMVRYGHLMGFYGFKGWSKKYLKYRFGMSEQMIKVMEMMR